MKSKIMKIPTLALAVFTILMGTSSAVAEKPNVLFIFADDMSYETIGAHGLLDIDTPNLDKLVEGGTSFTRAYNMGSFSPAVCMASRSMLNTGKTVWNSQPQTVAATARSGKFWPQRMSAAGYKTYMTGKWHVPRVKPESVFDVVKLARGGMPKQTEAGYNRPKDAADYEAGWKPWDPQYGGFWEGGTHWSELTADVGVEFIEQAAESGEPFFMYVAFNAPHDPRQAPKEFIDRYPLDRIAMPENFLDEYPYADEICGKQLRDERLMPYPRSEFSTKVNRQEYFALITHMDEQIGRVLDALKASGMADNTYIVFTADHGLAVGRHGLVGKQNMYEHSVRVPFIVTGPDVAGGKSLDAPMYLQDVMPTALELAGDKALDELEFKSLMPLLSGKSGSHYAAIYGAYLDTQRMITQEDWKLIVYPEIGVKRLFNIAKDPDEMNDLSGSPEYAVKLKELSDALLELSQNFNDPMVAEGGSSESWFLEAD